MDIIKLSDRDHVLKRPSMYVGAVDRTEFRDFVINGETISYETISVVPGLIKIINEIIDNSVDASIRVNFKAGTNISIKVSDTEVQVKDDGTGIKSQKSGEHYPCELAWGFARAGSNFNDDENRTTIGLNGVGSFCTNVYSTKFVGESDDGIKCIKFISKNNAESYKVEEKPTKSQGTTVTFTPDLKRFKLEKIDDTHKNVIYQRLLNLSICYPQINFRFNGKAIRNQNFKRFAGLFGNGEVYENSQVKVAIVPNETDDFKHYSYVNGLKISDGGIHVDEIMAKVVSGIREKLQKKYKNIKPGDIKNKLTCIVFIQGFPNAKFNSQSKEKLTNSAREFNDFAKIDYKFVGKIINNKNIIDPIVEIYKIKEEFENRKALKSVETKKKLKSEKYFKCTGTPKYLCICEGFSAYGGISVVLGNKNFEYYVLKGKPLNAFDISNQKLTSNRELSELYQLLNNVDYSNILITVDADADGDHILGLLSGFFYKFLPEQCCKVGRFKTPVKMVLKGDKPVRWTYDLQEELESKPGEHQKYFKGLGTHSKEGLEFVIEKDGFENMIELYEFNNDQILKDFLSSEESDKRKDYIRNHEFSIAKV